MQTSSTIVAMVFHNSEVPDRIYDEIHRLHNLATFEVLDVSEFEIKDNGKIKFERAMTLPLIGTSDGYFLEAFVGLIFFQAPHNKNVERAISAIQLDQKFIQTLIEKAEPGTALLFLRLQSTVSEKALGSLASLPTEIFTMALTSEQETRLEILFHGKPTPEFETDHAPLH